MLDKLIQWDKELFLALNGAHCSFMDFIMFWASNKFIWIPLYIFFLLLLYKHYKWKSLVILLFAGLMILISDQVSLQLFKNTFFRLRPCHNPEIMDVVHLVKNKCGGQYGFISSHACNTFALAVFLNGWLARHYKYFTPLIFIWALIISYSRIYLGVHSPGDVIVGIIIGAVIGYLIFLLSRSIIKKPPST